MATEIRNTFDKDMTVSRVIVSGGEPVEKGDTVAILHYTATDEGYPITSGVSGVVARVVVADGDAIKAGDLIAVIG